MPDFPDRRFDWRRLALVALLALAAWAAGERYAYSDADPASGQADATPALSVNSP